MTYLKMGSFKLLICVFILYAVVTLVDSRGGGRGGGFRGGRYRGGRSGSGRMSRGSSIYSRSTWKAAFLAGAVLGSTRYMRSSRYYSNRDHMPTICSNFYDVKNSTGQQYKYFVCPREGEPDDFDYCCGSKNREHCCKFTDSPGVIAGIVIGSLVGFVLLFVIIYCICKRTKTTKKIKTAFSSNQVTAPRPDPAVVYTTNVDPPPPYSADYGGPTPYDNKAPIPAGNPNNPMEMVPPPMEFGSPVQPYPAQPYPAPPYPAPPYASQVDSAQPYGAQSNPVQPYPSQPDSAQPYGAQPNPVQPYPGQMYPAQPDLAQPYPPQPLETKPNPVQ